MAENTREIVLDILLTLEREDIFSNQLIKAVLDKYDYLEGRDKAFIKRVTEGTIERQIELDYYLNQLSTVQVRRMKPLIRCLLRMSAYQLLYMDAVPDSAVCNEACKLAEKRRFRNLKGFVNGVLRNLAKKKENLPLPDEHKETALYYSVKYSCPQWLVEMWLDEYGREITATILEGLLRIHPVSLRFRTGLSQEEIQKLIDEMANKGVQVRRSGYLPWLYMVDHAEGIHMLPGFSEGAFTVQDVSSALAVEAAGIQNGDFVMDICAAPGGKSILASEKAGKVLARDVSESKIFLIEENLTRMQAGNVITQVFDATVTDETYLNKADVVLMDVPCSGLGILGKKRDIKYRVTPESLADITELQKKIVEKSWQYVKPGGILLYSTCTIHRAENEDMVQWIIENFPFEPVSLEESVPEQLLEQRAELAALFDKMRPAEKRNHTAMPDGEHTADIRSCCMQLLPGYMDADGFFFCKLRRRL